MLYCGFACCIVGLRASPRPGSLRLVHTTSTSASCVHRVGVEPAGDDAFAARRLGQRHLSASSLNSLGCNAYAIALFDQTDNEILKCIAGRYLYLVRYSVSEFVLYEYIRKLQLYRYIRIRVRLTVQY